MNAAGTDNSDGLQRRVDLMRDCRRKATARPAFVLPHDRFELQPLSHINQAQHTRCAPLASRNGIP
jgi:hypothetical protein